MAYVDNKFRVQQESHFEDDVLVMSDDENTAPIPSGVKPFSRGAGLAVLSPNQNKDNVVTKAGKQGKTVESQYRKLSQREHCLVRPDTYIGSVQPVKESMFILDQATDRLVSREITFTPGLYKIFDEILVNAADNKQRDENMDMLDIVVDADANTISVKNNGNGIPVVEHKDHNCYVPTLIFGHLLTGSNFDDDEKKTTGGRNGYGAKLTNIFSTKFVVECVDAARGLKFTQVFEDNMSIARDPVVKNCTSAEKKKGDYTLITFSPDLKRFNMESLDKDTVGLLSKRAYDIAGSMSSRSGKKLAVSLNGKKLPIKCFQDYLKLFDGIKPPVAYEKVGERWEVGVSASDGSPAQISFVNAISTSKGGSHVNHIADQIATHLLATIKKKNKGGADVRPAQIKNHLCIFVNCLVDNPVFDSQTKDFLTLQKKAFGSTCKLSEKFLKQVDKSEIVDSILSFAKFKADRELKKKGGTKSKKITGIAKLDDANFAGGAKSKDCTLIVTEGDSAKSLAMSGLSVVGRDYYGVFPLKGKLLNVRDAAHTQVIKNEEIKNIIDIMGLRMGFKYDETNIRTLRYGHLMIMADQDHDGSHIKGLVINMIHTFWPSLLDIPGFLQQFITPIVKATKGRNSKTFFTLPQYEQWRESTANNAKGWKIKYYKGLGTSTSAEAKEYFSNLGLHEISFTRLSKDVSQEHENMDCDGAFPDQAISSSGADLIDMAFRKTRVDDRKTWLSRLEKNTYLDYAEAKAADGVRYSDFINKELILFSQSDNERSIPHVMDGFKPSQRKVLFSCFKRKLKDEIKVAQLAGYVSEHSAYHHGEVSLHGTIIGMAQSFVGSNNINLLTPSGQFGTRRMGGKDAASPRYVFTKLENITRAIFHPDDDELLNYQTDDGVSIEPEFYMPVIPMILVNGSDGIGTGYSSCINNHDPRAIVENLRRMIQGEPVTSMKPHFCGFTGEIAPMDEEGLRFSMEGKIERTNETTLIISELPVRVWTQTYKEFLEKMIAPDGKVGSEPEIKDFMENHTESTVAFTITADKEKIDAWEKLPKGGLYSKFKLTTSLANTNMTVFDVDTRIVKYDKPEDIMKEFFNHRMDFYVRRKSLLVEKLEKEQRMLSNKARFVEEVCSGQLVVSNRKKVKLLQDLQQRGYDMFDKIEKIQDQDQPEGNEVEEEEEASTATLSKGYEYLLGMKIWSLTYEKAEALRKQLEERTAELETLQATTPSEIWLRDLDNIDLALDERDATMEEAEADEHRARGKTKKYQAKKAAAAASQKRGKKKASSWDSDLEDDESEDDALDLYSDRDEEVAKMPAPRRKPAATQKIAAKAAVSKTKMVAPGVPVQAKVLKEPPPQVDDVELTLAQRLAKRLSPSEATVEASSSTIPASISTGLSLLDVGTVGDTKRPSPRNNASDITSLASKPKAKPQKAVATKKTAQATAKRVNCLKKKQSELYSDSDDDFSVGEAGGTKRPSPRNSDSDSISEMASKPKAKRPKAVTTNKTVHATAKRVNGLKKKEADRHSDSDDDFSVGKVGGTKRPSPRNNDSDSSDSFSAVASKPKAKRPKAVAIKKTTQATAKKTNGRKKKLPEPESDSDDDFAFDSGDVEEIQAPPVRPAGGRSARATAARNVVYTLSSDEEGSESDYE